MFGGTPRGYGPPIALLSPHSAGCARAVWRKEGFRETSSPQTPLCVRQGFSEADRALQFADRDLKKSSLVIWLLCHEQPITKEEPMVQRHRSTPEQLLQWSAEMIAH